MNTPARLPSFRWVIVALLFFAAAINYIDRQTISVAIPTISKELGLSRTDYATIVNRFLLAYAVTQIVAGRFIDRIGTKRGFSLAIVWWSVANMLTGLGQGVASFSLFRSLLGVGEAAGYPASFKAIAEWFPKSERATAAGFINAGTGLGAILAPPLVAALIAFVGWRWTFAATGALGFIWLIAWRLLYYLPREHPRLKDDEKLALAQAREDGNAGAATKTPWLHFFLYKEVWGVMLARFVCDGAFYFFVFWLPTYLADARQMSLAQIGAAAWFPFLAADIGSLAGGWTSSGLIKRGWSLDASRKLVIWLGALLVPAILLITRAESPYTALLLVGVGMFAIQFKSSSLFAVPGDLARAENVAAVWGLSGAAGSLGGMLFTYLVGIWAQAGNYGAIFAVAAAMHLVSALLVMLLIPRIKAINEA
jgi:ACS family hexuronate transporter-like MFS transporter